MNTKTNIAALLIAFGAISDKSEIFHWQLVRSEALKL